MVSSLFFIYPFSLRKVPVRNNKTNYKHKKDLNYLRVRPNAHKFNSKGIIISDQMLKTSAKFPVKTAELKSI